MDILEQINQRVLPYKKFVIQSYLSPEEVIKKIHNKVTPEKPSFFFVGKRIKSLLDEGYRYYGNTNVDRFQLSRIIFHRNSFIPQIEGFCVPTDSGSLTTVEMKLNSFVKGFLMLWVAFLSLMILITLFVPAGSFLDKVIMIILYFFMLMAGLGIARVGFSGESRRSKQDLVKLLEGEEV